MTVWRAVASSGDPATEHVELVRLAWLPGGQVGFPTAASGRLARLVGTGADLRLEQEGRTVVGPATVVRSGRWYDEVRGRLRSESGLLDRLRLRRTDAVVLLSPAAE